MNNALNHRDAIMNALAPLKLGRLEAPPDKALLKIKNYCGLEEIRITICPKKSYREPMAEGPLCCQVWYVNSEAKGHEISCMDPVISDALPLWLNEVMKTAIPYWKHHRMYVDTFSVFKPEYTIITEPPPHEPIEELELGVRPFNALKRANINTIRELINHNEEEILRIRNLGKSSFEEITDRLAARGLALRAEL